MGQELDKLLELCTVKLIIPGRMGWGTGFFVAPGHILTCAHIVKNVDTQFIRVCWQNQNDFADASVVSRFPDPLDIALLHFDLPKLDHPCVYLDETVQSGNELYFFGYPDQEFPNGCPVTVSCEGLTGDAPPLIKFKLGQVRPGMSGSPMLNERTGKVCGMVKFTRDRGTDLGGGAIPVTTILDQFGELKDLQAKFHRKDRRWRNLLYPRTRFRSMVLISGIVTVLVAGIRFIALLQPLELMAYDVLLSLRPHEDPDNRIVIVGITQEDHLERTEISNEKLLELLVALKENYRPEIIGLDVYVDQPYKIGNDKLVTHIAQRDDVIAACLVAPKKVHPNPATIAGAISPRTLDETMAIPSDRLGFTNVPSEDFLGFNFFKEPNIIRRYQLTFDEQTVSSTTCNTGFSFGLLLAIEYLEAEEETEYMLNNQDDIEFSQKGQKGTVLKELKYRGYGGDGGYQVLLNYRSPHPQQGDFRRVSVNQIIQGKINPSDLEGRVVLIGYTDESSGQDYDFHHTPYSFGQWPLGQRMAGVVIHTHLVSQILSSVLDHRPQLSVWPPFYDLLWIGLWSFIGGGLTWLLPSAKLALVGSATVILLSALCFILLLKLGWWAPLIPPAFAVFLATWVVRRMARITPRNPQLQERLFGLQS